MGKKMPIVYDDSIKILIQREKKDQFKELADSVGITMSDLIRLTIQQYLRQGFEVTFKLSGDIQKSNPADLFNQDNEK